MQLPVSSVGSRRILTASVHELGRDVRGSRAQRAFKSVCGAAEQRCDALDRRAWLLGVAAVEHHGIRAVGVLDAVELAYDGVVSLVPGDGLPLGLPGALGIRAAQRRLQALGVVKLLDACQALGAKGRGGMGRSRFDAHDLAVLDVRGHAALGNLIAHVAVRVAFLDRGIGVNCALGVRDVEAERAGQRASGGQGGRALHERAAADGVLHRCFVNRSHECALLIRSSLRFWLALSPYPSTSSSG